MKKLTILGLGNPGAEYEKTRHNAGRMAAAYFSKAADFEDFRPDKKSNALIAEGKLANKSIIVALPETFMNKSGISAAKLLHPKKDMPDLIILHDDLDIPLGLFKISFAKNSGGHKGVESVMRAIKTKNFYRVRIGVSPKKKPDDVIKFIIGKFKPAEEAEFKKILKKVSQALEMMITDSPERAMSEFNK
ncbi:aminoacyl-tRNA hydrolase [Candidatus Giovannonibacteria bacterium]|nr:aminoacyl-tRNA hydrolase [Candidatus Giovannonibacteria bacterium]